MVAGPSGAAAAIPSLLTALAGVPDRRKRRGRRYRQASMLTFAVCAMLCGARSLYAIAQWGRDQAAADVRAALGIDRASTPSVATLFRLFRDLDVAAFEQALADWITAQGIPAGEAIAVDGKSIRGLHGEAVPGIHVVAAYAQHSGQVLGQKGGPNATPN
jgi:DDE_Tnp_1-associated